MTDTRKTGGINMSFDTGSADRSDLSDGAATAEADELGPDPKQAARDAFDRCIADGRTQETAAAESLATLAQAALRGDKRVIVEGY